MRKILISDEEGNIPGDHKIRDYEFPRLDEKVALEDSMVFYQVKVAKPTNRRLKSSVK